MISKPLVSVIMSVYKEPEAYLRASIESILNQTFKDFEFLIAIDDPQNNEVVKVVKEYAKSDDRIKYFINEENLGLPTSLNLLISKSKGEYLARMDGDDISLEHRLEKQIEYMEENNDIGILGTLAYKMDESGIIYGTLNMPTNEKHIDIYFNNGMNPLIHPSIIVRRKVYEKLGGYRCEFIHAEDYDFYCRARKIGIKLQNLNHFLLKYRVHSHKYKISYNSYLQYKSAKFIAKSYKSQIRDDEYYAFFKKLNSDDYLDEIFAKLYTFSRTHFIKATDFKSKNKTIKFLMHFLLSCISPHHLDVIFRAIKTKFSCRLDSLINSVKIR